MDTYKEFQSHLRQAVASTIRTGYDHLRPNPHKNKPSELDPGSKFRLSTFVKEKFVPKNGRVCTFSPLEIVFMLYGDFPNPSDFKRGFECNDCLRVGVGLNTVMDADPLLNDIYEGINLTRTGIQYALENADAEHFAEIVVPIVDKSIDRFKRKHTNLLPVYFS